MRHENIIIKMRFFRKIKFLQLKKSGSKLKNLNKRLLKLKLNLNDIKIVQRTFLEVIIF